VELISRQEAIDALRDYLVGKRCPDDGTLTCRLIENEVVNKLPSALSTNLASLSTDCISRQRAIDAFNTNINELVVAGKENADAVERYLNRVIDKIKQLPPIQPKRGRWHYSDGKPARIGLSFGVVCDQCGTESEYCTNFCGECGADMRQREE
jgi:hypothetical protein